MVEKSNGMLTERKCPKVYETYAFTQRFRPVDVAHAIEFELGCTASGSMPISGSVRWISQYLSVF